MCVTTNSPPLPPPNTRVILTCNADELSITLPPIGFRGLPLFFIVFSCFWFCYGLLSIAFLQAAANYGPQNWGLEFFFILFTFVFMLIFCGAIYFATSNKVIRLTPETFKIGRNWFLFNRVYTGQTDHITPIGLEDMRFHVLKTSISTIVLYDMGRQHILAPWLSVAEKQWLLQEIALFLNLPYATSAAISR